MKHFPGFLLLCAALYGCSGEEPARVGTDDAWFPLYPGRYLVYTVEEKRYTPGAAPVEEAYELMLEVVDSFKTAAGPTYVLQRSRRADVAAPWEAVDTWSARMTPEALILAEGNIPYARLTFPVRQDARWDGNRWNDLGEDVYTVTACGVPWQAGGMSFENTVSVEQENNDDRIVYRDQRMEVYAEGVGLIHRKVIRFTYCTDDSCLGQEIVEEGQEVTLTIKAYGEK